MEETNDREQWDALLHGVSLEQYRDAVRIADIKSDLQKQSRALALFMKYDHVRWQQVINTTIQITRERVRLSE